MSGNKKKPSPNDAYEVGYRKPPQHTRFQSGRSGNPNGRPKGSRNFGTALEQELNAPVTVTEHGITRKIPKRQVIAKQLVNQAASGNLKATAVLFSETRAREQIVSGTDVPPPAASMPADRLVMADIVRHIRSMPAESIAEAFPDASSPVCVPTTSEKDPT